MSRPEASEWSGYASARWRIALVTLAVLSMLAVVTGRVLEPALPGAAGGIAVVIRWSHFVGALTSQLLVVCAIVLSVRLLSLTLRQERLRALERLLVLPAGSVVVVVVIAAARRHQDFWLTVSMALCAALVAASAAPLALRRPETRAAGIVLAFTAISALTVMAGKTLAIQGSALPQSSGLQIARALSTVAFVFDLLSLAAAGSWIVAQRIRLALLVLGAGAAVTLLVLRAAASGHTQGASFAEVVAARAVVELLGYPAPFVPAVIRASLELLSFPLVIALVTLSRQRQRAMAAAMALIVLSRASPDVPALALVMVLGSLFLVLSAVSAGRGDSPGEHEPLAQPVKAH